MAWGLAALSGVAYLLALTFSPDGPLSELTPPAEAKALPREVPAEAVVVPPSESLEDARAGRIHRNFGAREALPRTASEAIAEVAVDDTEGGEDTAAKAFTPDAMIDAMADIGPGISDCVKDQESVMGTSLDGRLLLEMTLGPDGVIDAALVDVAGVPKPVLDCFGMVIYGTHWPLPEKNTDMAWPFQVVPEKG